MHPTYHANVVSVNVIIGDKRLGTSSQSHSSKFVGNYSANQWRRLTRIKCKGFKLELFNYSCFLVLRLDSKLRVKSSLIQSRNINYPLNHAFRSPFYVTHRRTCLSPPCNQGARLAVNTFWPPRHPPAAGGGIKLPPFTSATISSQREEIEKRNCVHIFLNT